MPKLARLIFWERNHHLNIEDAVTGYPIEIRFTFDIFALLLL
jgi:hypothetical protein